MAQCRRLLLQGASRLLNTRSPLPSSFILSRAFTDSKLFVGGLSFRTDENTLRNAFAAHGEVTDARIITDRETGRSRGFGFVTYLSEADAETALSKLNGQVLDGRVIRVDRASNRPPAARPMGGDFGSSSGPAVNTFRGFDTPAEPEPVEEDWGSIPSFDANIPQNAGDGAFNR